MPSHEVVFVRSIMMPPSPIITAVSVKGIIYPTSLRTVWRPPKRMSPYGAHHTADDRTGGPATRRPVPAPNAASNVLPARVPTEKHGASVVDRNRFDITFPRRRASPRRLRLSTDPASPAVAPTADSCEACLFGKGIPVFPSPQNPNAQLAG